ncbi:MAG: 4Fe-4S ferredoxin, iron-sulpur binding protein [Neobacillus sp.]|nr:4Fe-4S ferredoxin, iron-sulpur binding protein [Neobacillus sp.]
MVRLQIQYGFLVNLKRCTGCKGCELACRNEHHLSQAHRRTVQPLLDENKNIITFLSMSCNHCENPICIAVCPNHCFKKRRDGIVVHSGTNCSGCKSCVGACPFHAPKFDPITRKVDKCNLCVDRLEQNLSPICVSACINEALEIIDVRSQDYDTIQVISEIKMANFTNPSVRFLPANPVLCKWRENSGKDS